MRSTASTAPISRIPTIHTTPGTTISTARTTFLDNCPSLANTDQADRDADRVGDVCDPNPDSPGDRIAERTFFVDPDFDSERWAASEFEFQPGVVLDSSPLGTAMLRSRHSHEQSQRTVEVIFEALVWNTNPYVDGFSIFLDDIGGPTATVRYGGNGDMTLSLTGPGVPEGFRQFMPLVAPQIPIRLRLGFDRQTLQLDASVGAKYSRTNTTSALPRGPIYLLSVNMAVQVTAFVVYVVD